MRTWPIPHPDRTVQFVGDLHIQSQTETRKKLMRDDVTATSVTPRVQVGDFTANSYAGEDAMGVDFFDSLGGDWWAIAGNHDMVGRTAADAAAAWGMPGKDFTVDLGFASLVCIGPDTDSLIYRQDTTDWMAAQLAARPDVPCIIVCHEAFYGTVGVAPDDPPTKKSSFDLYFYVRGEAAIYETPDINGNRGEELWAVMEAHPNAKAWVSGHVHADLRADGIVKPVTMADGRGFVHVNAGTILGSNKSWLDPLATPYISVLDDRLEVRWRDHGAHQWVGTGTDLERVYTVMF